ncbi:MAG TPA: esterase-like activity of phytase family protein, partial [Ideonella sp.]|nr:esterase-like activity of phytase family protein [Ideonella sp.]
MPAPRSLRRFPLRQTAAIALALVTAACQAQPLQAAQPTALAVTYLGQQIVPTGTLFEGTQIGGLSGLDYDARSGLYSAISDDRSQNNPARFYEL